MSKPRRPRRPSPPSDPLEALQQMVMDRVLEGMDNIMNRVFSEAFPQSTFTPIMTTQPRVRAKQEPKPKPSKPPAPTLYDILQVSQSASPEVIAGAWRSLAKLYHPDVVKGHEKKMASVNQAYEILSDTKKRQAYDQQLRIRNGSST